MDAQKGGTIATNPLWLDNLSNPISLGKMHQSHGRVAHPPFGEEGHPEMDTPHLCPTPRVFFFFFGSA